MREIYNMISRESHLFLAKKNLAVWLIVLILMILNINGRILDYRKTPDQVQGFKQIQENHFKNTPNYQGYGRDGVKILYIPSPLWVLSANGAIPLGMMGRVDSIVTVQLYTPMKDKTLSPGSWLGRWDYVAINCLFITLMAMWYALAGFKGPEYTLFITNSLKPGKEYLGTAVVRFLLFIASFLVTQGLVYLFILLRGIRFSASDASGFIVAVLAGILLVLVFFASGLVMGRWGKRPGAYIAMFVVWAVLNLGVPGLVKEITEPAFPDKNRDYKVELDKYNRLMSYEDHCREKAGIFNRDNLNQEQEFAREYLEEVYPEIKRLESELKGEIARAIDGHNKWSIWFPTTFYRQVVNEAGSVGYRNYLDFYDYVQGHQEGFVRFYVDRVFYHNPKEMVNYIKGEEDIYRGKSYKPPYFGWGMLIQFLLGVVLVMVSYFSNKRVLFPKAVNPEAFARIKLDLKSNKINSIATDSDMLFPQFRQVVFGKPGNLPWAITLDGKSLFTGVRNDFVYIPNPSFIPGELKVKHVLAVLKGLITLDGAELDEIAANVTKDKGIRERKWGEIDNFYQYQLLLVVFKYVKARVIMVEDFARGFPYKNHDELYLHIDELKAEGKTLINLVYLGGEWLHEVDVEFQVVYNSESKQFKVSRYDGSKQS